MSIDGFPSLTSSVAAAIQSAGAQMSAAAGSIATGDMNGYVDASTDMTQAKLTLGIAAQLAHAENDLFQSTLNMLV